MWDGDPLPLFFSEGSPPLEPQAEGEEGAAVVVVVVMAALLLLREFDSPLNPTLFAWCIAENSCETAIP